MQKSAPFQTGGFGRLGGDNENPVRQVVDIRLEGHLLPAAGHPFPVEDTVDFSDGCVFRKTEIRVPLVPGGDEPLEILPTAFGAGPMACSQGGGLVTEEKLGVIAGGEHFPFQLPRHLQKAGYPVLVGPAPGGQVPVGVVEDVRGFR